MLRLIGAMLIFTALASSVAYAGDTAMRTLIVIGLTEHNVLPDDAQVAVQSK